jgi:hypothetical protein
MPEEPTAHQLYKQIPRTTFTFPEDFPSTDPSATNGWQAAFVSGSHSLLWHATYLDLAGWSAQDLTAFYQGMDLQIAYMPTGDTTAFPVLKVMDIITTRPLTETEITSFVTGSSPAGFVGNTVDLMEVVYAQRVDFAVNSNIDGTYVQTDAGAWGSGNPNAMSKLHWTRVVRITSSGTIAPGGSTITIYDTNLVLNVITVKEKDLVYMERLRRSYVLQDEVK